MYELKPLSKDAIPAALAKAERYRLLNEPGEAQSICHDILTAAPGHQEALVMLLLALCDQCDEALGGCVLQAQAVLGEIRDPYARAYYSGLLLERRGKAQLRRAGRGVDAGAFEYIRDAMRAYEQAEAIRPAGNDDALLRWNACARVLMRHPDAMEQVEERYEPYFE